MDEQIIKRGGILIPVEKYRSTKEYKKIKKFLTRRQKVYNSSEYITNIFYLETNNYLTIPRHFPLHEYMKSPDIKDCRHEGEDININHNIEPRSKTQFDAIEYLMSNESGILQLSPGVGKTVISIYMIAERKKKSIILVHRDGLADQWKERILNFTDLQEDDISRLSSKTFEEDLSKPIIISTVQTFLSLIKRKYQDFLKALYRANIGVCIADEVHTSVGAPTFSQCIAYIPSKYIYGLSATPYRIDGNEDIIKFHLGEIFKDEDVEGTMDPIVTCVFLDYKINTYKRYKYLYWGGSFQRSRYLNLITKSDPFLNVIKQLLLKLKNERKIICTLERIKLIDKLFEWLPHSSKSKFCGSAKLDTLESDVTFSTPGKCRDGVDAPWKDCVIMTSPISNIEQLTGRVVRTAPNKKIPTIIDMIDYKCKDIYRTFYKREKFYKNKNWKIQYLLYKDDKLITIDDQVVYELLNS